MDVGALFKAVGEFMKVYGPWIMTALIPTLITGLSKSPKTQGAVSWLKYLLQILSILTPSDTPGTFKLPLKAVSPSPLKLPKKGDSDASKVVVFLLAGSLAFGNTSCSWLTNIGSRSKDGVVNCGVEAIMSQAANLIATVRAILTGGAVNWREQLDALKEMGEDALACALYIVGDELLRESVPPVDTMGDSPEKQKMRAVAKQGHNKAEDYLKANNLKPTGPKEIK